MAAQNVNVKPGSEYVFYINNVTNIIISSCQWPEQYQWASTNS